LPRLADQCAHKAGRAAKWYPSCIGCRYAVQQERDKDEVLDEANDGAKARYGCPSLAMAAQKRYQPDWDYVHKIVLLAKEQQDNSCQQQARSPLYNGIDGPCQQWGFERLNVELLQVALLERWIKKVRGRHEGRQWEAPEQVTSKHVNWHSP
jgi:hypothetical protein